MVAVVKAGVDWMYGCSVLKGEILVTMDAAILKAVDASSR
jgi:hypothetical protein